jgi:hypothetical protein
VREQSVLVYVNIGSSVSERSYARVGSCMSISGPVRVGGDISITGVPLPISNGWAFHRYEFSIRLSQPGRMNSGECSRHFPAS